MYSRQVNGRTLTFGVSGKLWKNALIMYDRETDTLWSHLTGEAVYGPLEGETLDMLSAVPRVKWKDWHAQHPDTQVLSVRGREDQRHDNYSDYHRSRRTGLFTPDHRDKRLKDKDRVIGVTVGDLRKAYPMAKEGWKGKEKGIWKLVQDQIGDTPVVVFYDPDRYVTGVYDLRLGEGKKVKFEGTVESYVANDKHGGKWNLLVGEGPEGQTLAPIPHMNVYWFAWADFYPEALLYEHKKARD